MSQKIEYIDMIAEIVSAYVGSNNVSPADLPGLIREVHSALIETANGHSGTGNSGLMPAVPIKKSITPDYIICLEDGKKFKSLKRHLQSHYNLTPAEYREKWGLPADYPMVSPNYAKARSTLARDMGLGQKRVSPTRRKRPSSPSRSNS